MIDNIIEWIRLSTCQRSLHHISIIKVIYSPNPTQMCNICQIIVLKHHKQGHTQFCRKRQAVITIIFDENAPQNYKQRIILLHHYLFIAGQIFCMDGKLKGAQGVLAVISDFFFNTNSVIVCWGSLMINVLIDLKSLSTTKHLGCSRFTDLLIHMSITFIIFLWYESDEHQPSQFHSPVSSLPMLHAGYTQTP